MSVHAMPPYHPRHCRPFGHRRGWLAVRIVGAIVAVAIVALISVMP